MRRLTTADSSEGRLASHGETGHRYYREPTQKERERRNLVAKFYQRQNWLYARSRTEVPMHLVPTAIRAG